MKIVLVIILATAGVVAAQMPATFPGNRRADEVNRRVLDPKNLNLKLIPSQTHETGVSPVSAGRAAAPVVATEQVDLRTLSQPTRTTAVLGQKNFGAKRAAVSDKRGPSGVVATGPAPITDRTIKATVPAGEAELVEQLRKYQKR
jgi:hypothetical protein